MINLTDIESINQIKGRGTVIAVDTRKYPVPFDVGMMVCHEDTHFVVDGIEMGGMGDHVSPIIGLQVSVLKGAPGKHAWRFQPICPWCGKNVPEPCAVLFRTNYECPECNQQYVIKSALVYKTARAERFVESNEIEEG